MKHRDQVTHRLLFLALAVLLCAAGGVLATPAARMGSLTDHGGVVIQGSPNVLIEGASAARVGDLVACPLTCGTQPHGTGPIVTGSATVFINGQPAARVGSLVTESCAQSTISVGALTVDIGG